MKKTPLLLSLLSAIALVSCGEEKQASTEQSSAQSTSPLQALILDQAPTDAVEIATVRTSAKVGDTVTINGKVMGSKEPFVEGRAIMLLGDPNKLTSCDLKADDQCPTPWDVCCDDPDVIKNSIVTVQALDSDGKLVKEGLKGLAEIKELTNVVVTGTVADSSTASNMLINASGIYVKQ